MDILCDANIWYQIGFGKIDPDLIKDQGHRLIATPVNFLEFASRVEVKNLNARRLAAKAVIDHADEIIDDPERHLASIWQVTIPDVEINWKDGFQALAETPDLPTLQAGVVDPIRLIRRAINVPFATAWRVREYDQFEQDMITVVDNFWPGYAAARIEGRITLMPKGIAAEFDKVTKHPELLQYFILATYARVFLHQPGQEPPTPDSEVREAANKALEPYSRIYQKYVVKLASEIAPQPNDWGDLECFVYAQESRRIYTLDKRWLDIANESGCGKWLYVP